MLKPAREKELLRIEGELATFPERALSAALRACFLLMRGCVAPIIPTDCLVIRRDPRESGA